LFGLAGNASAGTIYVDANAAPGGNGASWGTAYKYLQDALYKPPTSGDEIWVATGTYKPDQDEGSNVTAGDRNATFELINGVSLYGGFPIGGGTWEERDPNQHKTILNGDLNDDDEISYYMISGIRIFEIINISENCYNVVTSQATDNTTVLDGFTITGGNADSKGGGLYISNGNPVISNCVFKENSSQTDGGGIANVNNSSPLIVDCLFINNLSVNYQYGGGLFSEGTPTDRSNPTVKSCIFLCNYAGGGGGVCASEITLINCIFKNNTGWSPGLELEGIHDGPFTVIETYPKLIGCKFIGNTGGGGGGVYVHWDQWHPTFVNCQFSNNLATWYSLSGASQSYGGAIYLNTNTPGSCDMHLRIDNCLFAYNKASCGGGAIAGDPTDAIVNNTIFWENRLVDGTLSHISYASPTVSYSCLQDENPDDASIPYGGSANGNIDDYPIFIREPNDGGDGWGVGGNNDFGWGAGDNDDFGNLRFQYISPCIDTADNASVPADSEDLDEDLNTAEPIPYDLDNHPRIVDGDCNSTDVVDMGTYEFSHVSLGDFAGGCDVDFADFAVLALAWLTEEGQAGYDSNCDIAIPYDKAIDEKDLQVFTENWLFGR